MDNKLKNIPKRSRGRPKGSSSATIRAISIITNELAESLEILNKRGKSLAECLADEFEQSPSRVLTAVSRYLPQKIELDVKDNNPFIQSLREVNERMTSHVVIDHVDQDKNSD